MCLVAAAATAAAAVTTATAAAASTAAAAVTTTAATAATASTAAVTAAAASTTAEAAATAARCTWLHGASFVHDETASTILLAIHAVDGSLCLSVAAHFHKAEAFGAASVTFHHDFGAGNGTVSCECLLQVFVTERIRQIAYVKFVAHERTPQNNSKRDLVRSPLNLLSTTNLSRLQADGKLTRHRKKVHQLLGRTLSLCAKSEKNQTFCDFLARKQTFSTKFCYSQAIFFLGLKPSGSVFTGTVKHCGKCPP